MGNPMDGDIYEGQLRPGDVGLTKEEANRFKELSMQDRMAEFKKRFREQDAAQAATSSGVDREMPRYKCHKEVWALKIAALVLDDGHQPGATITPIDAGYAPFHVDHTYLSKHLPQIGGYYVVYKDGYKSYSPAQAFEEGYTKI